MKQKKWKASAFAIMVFLTAFAAVSLGLTGCAARLSTRVDLSDRNGNFETERQSSSDLTAKEDSENHASGETPKTIENTEASYFVPVSEHERREISIFLESFESDLNFMDMDTETILEYADGLAEYYDFLGRVTEDGTGYLLGFPQTERDPLNGTSVYWNDGRTVIASWDENAEEEKILHTLPKVSDLRKGMDNGILYLQPMDLEMPEELVAVFGHQYCEGKEGQSYLRDAISRDVRFTPPDTGAYLAVIRMENGWRYLEYVELTPEEEKSILASDMMILPEEYGFYGIQFVVSQEAYEEGATDEGPVSLEALEIAKERCRFTVVPLTEIHDLVKAEMKLERWVEPEKSEGKNSFEGYGQKKTETEILEDPLILSELENLLLSAAPSRKDPCAYHGILTLTRSDGEEIVLQVATDSCRGFVIGSMQGYEMNQDHTEQFWSLFSAIRPYTGWEPPS